jgi:hypothetical protein
MPDVILDFDPPQPDAPGFGGDQSDLVYFLSFAYAGRFGAQHELSLLALTLQTEFRVNLKPLLTFADREVEEDIDEETLTAAWQEAAPLAACCEAAVAAIDTGDRRLAEPLQGYPGLRDRLAELGRTARWAKERGGRIRVTYSMAADE